MSKIKFLLVDDESDIEPLKRRLETTGDISLQLERPSADWTAQVDKIHKVMCDGYSGLLIDFRLDQSHDGAPTKDKKTKKLVRYTAEALVPELRRRSVEGGKDESYPIVLWSTAGFLEGFYGRNTTYSRVYDDIWDKKDVGEEIALHAQLLPSLAKGYAQLREAIAAGQVSMEKLLATTDLVVLREFDQFMQKWTRTHPYAFHYGLFIRHDILRVTGPLIDEHGLHAFLGTAPLSAADYATLFTALGPGIRYTGVFADSHVRFWRQALLKALEAVTGTSSWLSMAAVERVALLKKKVQGIQPVAAEPIDRSYATDYDCVCNVTKRPLSRRNGYRFLDAHPLPWKEPNYVAAVVYRRKYTELSKTRPLEAEDMERFRAQYS